MDNGGERRREKSTMQTFLRVLALFLGVLCLAAGSCQAAYSANDKFSETMGPLSLAGNVGLSVGGYSSSANGLDVRAFVCLFFFPFLLLSPTFGPSSCLHWL